MHKYNYVVSRFTIHLELTIQYAFPTELQTLNPSIYLNASVCMRLSVFGAFK